eukprot:289571_1
MRTVCIDNGGGKIRGGIGGSVTPKVCFPNCAARLRYQLDMFIGDQIQDSIRDKSQLTLIRPLDRGYVLNWEAEVPIWERMMECLGESASEVSLLLTEAPFPPLPLQEAMNEVVFEEFGFAGHYRCPSAAYSAYGAHIANEKSNVGKTCKSYHSCEAMIVVDTGFSFTHIVPFHEGMAIQDAVVRLNIGGKLLTNYLMEVVSYSQLNVVDDFLLMEAVKESVSYVSSDFVSEIHSTKRRRPVNGCQAIPVEFVLPDYKTITKGYMREPQDIREGTVSSNPDAQVLHLLRERFAVPELLFNPSDIGVKQAGVAECVLQSIGKCPKNLQPLLFGNILLTGGNCKIPGFVDRVRNEVRCMAEDHIPVNVWSPNDPDLYAWRGQSAFAMSNQYSSYTVTKSEYEEHGHAFCSARFSDW